MISIRQVDPVRRVIGILPNPSYEPSYEIWTDCDKDEFNGRCIGVGGYEHAIQQALAGHGRIVITMTLSELNKIASTQKVEPDLPGVHSSGLLKAMPEDVQRKLFQDMRNAVGPMGDDDFEKLDALVSGARRTVEDCKIALQKAEAEFDRLNELRATEINRRLETKGHL